MRLRTGLVLIWHSYRPRSPARTGRIYRSQPPSETDTIQVANLEQVVLGQQLVYRPEPHVAGVGVPSHHNQCRSGRTIILLRRLAAATHTTGGGPSGQ